MKKYFLQLLFVVFLCLFSAISAFGQNDEEKGTARKVLNGTAKTSVIVIGTTAKYSWKATKFTAGKVVKPVLAKAVPATGKFVLKTSGKVVKRSVPVFKKTVVTYIKLRLSL